MIIRALFLLLALMATASAGLQRGAPPANASSAIGISLAAVAPNNTEQPFLNAMKTGGGWYTISGGTTDTAEEAYLYTNCLDANGYPTTLTTTVGSCASGGHTFNEVSTRLTVGITFYSGNWVLLYDGAGTVTVDHDGSGATSCAITGFPNRFVFTSSAAGVGIGVNITATTVGNAVKNIRVVYSPDSTCGAAGTRETLLNNGEIFNPDFISKLAPFKILRMIDWMFTVGSTQSTWANRPPPGWVFWDETTLSSPGQASGTPYTGVPAETMIALCNEVGAHCWFNIPHAATDDYITQFATLAHNTLKPPLKVYTELSDELWNSAGLFNTAYSYVDTQAIATFGGDGLNGHYNWQGMQQARVGTIWKGVWGADASRVVNPIGVQAFSSTSFATQSNQILTTPLWTGTGTPLVWTASIDNGTSGSGNVMHVTAVTSGTLAVGSPVYDTNGNVALGTTVTAMAPTVACGGIACTGGGGTGTYALSSSTSAASEGMIGGGGPAPGGPAQSHFDAIAIAPYFGYGPLESWASSADGGLGQVFTEIISGGLIPTGSSPATVTGGPTAFVVASSGVGCAATLVDQCTITVQVPSNTLSGTPTLQVDGGLAKNLKLAQNGGGLATIDNTLWCLTCGTNGNGVVNVTYMSAQNAWVVVFWLGYPGGMLKQAADTEARWVTYGNGLALPLPIIGYEGGQNFNGNQSTAMNTLVGNVETDERMANVNDLYLQQWRSSGAQFFAYYNDIQTTGVFGYWGSTVNVLSNQPKYEGIARFMRRNPCWWSNCQ